MPHVLSLPTTQQGLITGSPAEIIRGTGSSGPRGIESIIEYRGGYLNVRDWIDTILVTAIDGIDDADIIDNREKNPGYHGETSFPSYYGGRTIVLTGKIVTHTIWKLRDMEQGLRQLFADISKEDPLIFRTNDLTTDMQINCKKSQPIKMTDRQTTGGTFERDFQVTLRASDPRFVSYQQKYASDGLSQISCDNEGNFPAQPRIRLTGPMTDPVISVTRADGIVQTFRINGDIPEGSIWNLDSNDHTFADEDDNPQWSKLDITSDWLELAPMPGSNIVSITTTGTSIGESAMAAYWRDTYM